MDEEDEGEGEGEVSSERRGPLVGPGWSNKQSRRLNMETDPASPARPSVKYGNEVGRVERLRCKRESGVGWDSQSPIGHLS